MQTPPLHRFVVPAALLAGLLVLSAAVPADRGSSPAPVVSGMHYELTFNAATAAARSLQVVTRFQVDAAGAVEMSLPTWTPGAYEVSDFARKVAAFGASQGGREIDWDKTDPDTWRVRVPAPGAVEVRFTYTADSLDNAMAWSRADFLLVNGTNVFLYPEGAGFDFPATVSVETQAGWRVATGMTATAPGRYRAASYHELVDMPLFVGRIDVDSARVDGTWHRVASYPVGAFTGPPRTLFWEQLQAMGPVMSRVFGDTPWTDYTTLLIFDEAYPGGSALEHANSHVGIYNPGFIGTPILASITAHEIIHAWNVKRLRPAQMVPYQYDRRQPTELLWVSEGITDYYADLALVRGGIIDSTVFLNVTLGKMAEVADLPPVALEDASLSTWISPTDGTHTIYYPKGSLAGLLLDILIRDASENRRSLDDVMRGLYESTYKQGRGFTTAEWWRAVEEAAGGRPFAEFAARYIDGRGPFPWSAVAPLAGLRYVADTISEPRIGISTVDQEDGPTVTAVVPGSAAAEAGIAPGDQLLRIGSIAVDANFGAAFRTTYRSRLGETVPVAVRRNGSEISLSMVIRGGTRIEEHLEFDRRAPLKAVRIRNGILTGGSGR